MKKVLCIVLTLLLLLPAMSGFAAEETPVTVWIDGEQLVFDVDPIIENGRTLVPMRGIFEALGATVAWDSDTRTVTAVRGDDVMKITIDQNVLTKNDASITLDVPAKIVNNRTLVPVRAVSEGLDAQVDWDGEASRVIITTKTEVALPFDTLAEDDAEAFKSAYADIRYAYEQQILPQAFFNEKGTALPILKKRDESLLGFPAYMWNRAMTTQIIRVQADSSHSYEIDVADEGRLEEGYEKLLTELGVEANQVLQTKYVQTPKKRTVLLVSLKDEDLMIACQYIAFVPDGDNIRCFTAEVDQVSPGYVFYCEIKENSRGSYGTVDGATANSETFLKFIDSKL